jgi:hypothetical protein
MAKRALIVFCALVVWLATGAPALAAPPPDRSGTVTPAAPFTWTGPTTTAANTAFDPGVAEPCGKAVDNYCDTTLVNVVPGDFYSQPGRGIEFRTRQQQDVDLWVYETNSTGTVLGDLVGASAGATGNEGVSLLGGQGFFLVIVNYFAVTNAGYEGSAEFFRRNVTPFDIDVPRGLQDTLASDPSEGWRSRSEMHIAQSPTDPKVLVAASKFYNRDPDSLPEYDFKVGSYASFDRAQSWADLGQINTCPMQQAPPPLWPLNHTCYPEDDPSLGGTEPEDVGDPRGTGDFGEGYITSDPWVDMDDEGNAYAMVLDSPSLASGNGWGMSFHRWKSVSRKDVHRDDTWSNRIIINAYETPEEQAAFLDDKNTFAVNNAGRDRDGKTGIIVACWGQNYDLTNFGRQRIVCERSTNGGRSWPDEPQQISAPLPPPFEDLPFGPFVIGVHVVADTQDPNTFYAVWLDTLSAFLLPELEGRSPMWFTKTTDGARTWEAPRIIQAIDQIPNVFPRQAFRNLSLPILAVGPRSELYMTWADYNPAPFPGDEDGFQADIHLTSSLDGGTTWTTASKINQDTTNADQFQPYLRVTKSGQVNAFFFDRRFDRPDPPAHPGNFFIDNFLARSNDRGLTWRETRLSHDSWDPSINPPISTSGEFIGDYQGLVADDCYAIPFVNDTHLANDPARDPAFDEGLPRSPFQQAFSYRVPNVRRYGGAFRGGDLPRGCDRKSHDHGHGSGGRPAHRVDILTSVAKVHRHGWFAVRLRCPDAAPGACRGRITVTKGGHHVAGTRFQLDRASKGDAWLQLDRDAREALARRSAFLVQVSVVPADRSVVRHDASARVRLVSGHKLAHAARRLTRGQARRLVGKYRVIAESWNR